MQKRVYWEHRACHFVSHIGADTQTTSVAQMNICTVDAFADYPLFKLEADCYAVLVLKQAAIHRKIVGEPSGCLRYATPANNRGIAAWKAGADSLDT